MLKSLTIHNILLIDRLEMPFSSGLCVLTGETGAGKSILLDALGLALGSRGGAGLVRPGEARGVVTATFEPAEDHPVWLRLDEQGLDRGEGVLILRRVIEADGKSRAFVNDQPAGVGLLKDLGDLLVEIHGQHADRGLLASVGHRRLLDAFGALDEALGRTRAAHAARAAAAAARAEEERALDAVRADQDYLRHSLEELDALAPQAGEEEDLAARRSLMQQSGKIRASLAEIEADLARDGGADALLRGALRRLERLAGSLGDAADPALQALDRAANEATEAIAQLAALADHLDFNEADLEAAEERLFALRAAARKHQCAPDALPDLREEFRARLAALDQSEDRLHRLRAAEDAAAQAFREAVLDLRAGRQGASAALDRAVAGELPPLKLDKARFRTRLDLLPEEDWGPDGGERVEFEVSTNPGAPFGPLMRIASGGEQSRFILALKVVLARKGSAPTLIFDEVDQGVGGAVADAVGERLARLARDAQVLVVTHSPQVAAAGRHHWRITKSSRKVNGAEQTMTRVAELDPAARQEEIARMLAGARITDAARAAAAQLMRK